MSVPILYLFQQIAQAVINDYVVLTFLLHVSTFTSASCGRYIKRRRSTANSVKDEGVWS
jgi:hypothetical protein